MPAIKSLSSLALALGAAAAAPAAHAALNTWDLFSRSIPASACTPRDAPSAARVEMVQGGWRFSGSNVGRVTFTCPLPISVFPADQAGGFSSTDMGFFRVWYRDSDGPGAAAQVLATPYLRTSLGAWSNIGLFGGGGGGFVPAGVCQFNSNTFVDLVFAARVKDCKHSIVQNALYVFEVTMSRETATQTVEFHGIDFDNSTIAG